jgi:hypothetical protein
MPSNKYSTPNGNGTKRRGRGRAAATNAAIALMIKIAEENQPCTVRHLAYQLFNAKILTSMSDKKQTDKVSEWSVLAREEGMIPWDWIVDETRQTESVATWDNPEDYARAVMKSWRKTKWNDQPVRIEVWSEKGTLAGMLRPVLREYEVPFRVLHGFSSATTIRDAAQEFLAREHPSLVCYTGDHDPSGMYMSEVDVRRRLARYVTDPPGPKTMPPDEVDEILDAYGIEVQRIALTRMDTRDLGPEVSFPVASKSKDSRFRWFLEHYGTDCWEIDAMSPVTLRERVEAAIVDRIDWELWNRAVGVEKAEHEMIVKACTTWTSSPQIEDDDG